MGPGAAPAKEAAAPLVSIYQSVLMYVVVYVSGVFVYVGLVEIDRAQSVSGVRGGMGKHFAERLHLHLQPH